MTAHAGHDDLALANRELLVRCYAAAGRGDLAGARELLSDDIQWRVHRPSPSAGTYHGKQQLLDWFPRMAAPYEGTLRVAAPAMVADARHGFVTVRESTERPARVSYTGVHVWEFADGKGSRFESYYDDTYSEFWLAHS